MPSITGAGPIGAIVSGSDVAVRNRRQGFRVFHVSHMPFQSLIRQWQRGARAVLAGCSQSSSSPRCWSPFFSTELANQAALDFEKERFDSLLEWHMKYRKRKEAERGGGGGGGDDSASEKAASAPASSVSTESTTPVDTSEKKAEKRKAEVRIRRGVYTSVACSYFATGATGATGH